MLALPVLAALLLLGRVAQAADRGTIAGTTTVVLGVLAVALVVAAVVLVVRRR